MFACSILRTTVKKVPAINAIRLLSFDAAKQPKIRIGSKAPNFEAPSTVGKLNFYNYLGDSWGILFSHPADFTPVCTTELGAFAAKKPEFDARNVKLLGLSVDPLERHSKWQVAYLYDMLTEDNFKKITSGPVTTIRSVFIVDPKKTVRLIMTYPPSVGRNTDEVLRVVDSLQVGDKLHVVTGVNWKKGDDVIIPPSLSNEDAKAKFGSFKVVKPYLRYTSPGKN
ncbi:hypothetical protein HII13_003761 [Brettanomyces bruxellensis]|nr:hypothetical protein HII13_003761 [Brettanomyces bruxellensis]